MFMYVISKSFSAYVIKQQKAVWLLSYNIFCILFTFSPGNTLFCSLLFCYVEHYREVKHNTTQYIKDNTDKSLKPKR